MLSLSTKYTLMSLLLGQLYNNNNLYICVSFINKKKKFCLFGWNLHKSCVVYHGKGVLYFDKPIRDSLFLWQFVNRVLFDRGFVALGLYKTEKSWVLFVWQRLCGPWTKPVCRSSCTLQRSGRHEPYKCCGELTLNRHLCFIRPKADKYL